MTKVTAADLFNGKIGNVMTETEFEMKYGFFEIDDGEDAVCTIEEFDFDGCDVIDLNKGEGYRGEGCYEAIVRKNGKMYFVSVVSEGCLYEFFE